MIDEEIQGTGHNDLQVLDKQIIISGPSESASVYLDENGWQELFYIVRDVCYEQGLFS